MRLLRDVNGFGGDDTMIISIFFFVAILVD